jgi:hypothetical protein
MAQDKNGVELQVGDVIACKFRVTNVIADAAKLNLLAEHYQGHKEQPSDWRLQLESSQVEHVESDDRSKHVKRAEDPKADVLPAEDEKTPEAHHRAKHK